MNNFFRVKIVVVFIMVLAMSGVFIANSYAGTSKTVEYGANWWYDNGVCGIGCGYASSDLTYNGKGRTFNTTARVCDSSSSSGSKKSGTAKSYAEKWWAVCTANSYYNIW